MKKAMKKLCLIMAAIMCIAILPCQVNATEAKPKLFIIGGSMAANQATAGRMGWGEALPDFFTDDVTIVNKAVKNAKKGTNTFNSSWSTVAGEISEGDYVLICFGDSEAQDNSTTAETMITNITAYVKDITDKKAIPVLITAPPKQSKSGGAYKDGASDYSEAVRTYAEDNDIMCLDAATATVALYNALETTKTDLVKNTVFMYGNKDIYSEFGAHEIAGVVVGELIKTNSPLNAYIKTISAPVIYDADWKAATGTVGVTAAKKKGSTLYHRAQFINKQEADTTVQLIMAEYDSNGALIGVLSQDMFTVPAKSVKSFDATYTMPGYAHAGAIKMFVWKDYDSLVPHGNDLIKWTFTAAAMSDNLVFEKTFDEYEEGSQIIDANYIAKSVNGNMGMYSVGGNAKYDFDAITIGATADGTNETIVEFDLYDTTGFNIELRSNSNGVLVLTTGGGDLAIGDTIITKTDEEKTHHIKIVIDEKAYTADFYVDGSGEAVATDVELLSGYTTLNRIQFKTNGSTYKLWIDNLAVYRQPIGTN